MGLIRLLVILYTGWKVFSLWRDWRNANKPVHAGGTFSNPFNDPHYFCCIFGTAPCPEQITCLLTGTDTVLTPRDLQASSHTIRGWISYIISFAFAVSAWVLPLGVLNWMAVLQEERSTAMAIVFLIVGYILLSPRHLPAVYLYESLSS